MRLIALFTLLLGVNASANCLIPGWPGCTNEDFQNAIQRQQQINIQQQQLIELQRANQLTQQLIEQQRRQQLNQLIWEEPIITPIVPQNYYMQQHQMRCLTMPLGTRGC